MRFTGAAGEPLVGVLHRTPGDAKGSVLLAHCFTCGKDLHTMTRLATGLAEHGYVAFRFDFTGLGESGGELASTTVTTSVGDLGRAALTLIQMGFGPCRAIGHSLGGAALLLAAARLRTVTSLAVIGAPSHPGHVRHLFGQTEDEIRRRGRATVTIAGRPFEIDAAFLDDLATHDQSKRVAELDRPLMVMHAVDDTVVPVGEGERIFAAARQPKAFVPLLGTDHLLADRPSAEVALRTVVDWFDRTG